MMNYWTKKILKQVLLYGAIFLTLCYTILPILLMMINSLRPTQEFFSIPPTIFPKEWCFENYTKLFTETHFPSWLMNSLIITVFVILFTVIIAMFGAYSLARFDLPGKRIFTTFSLFAYMLPPILMVIPLYLLALQVKLANTLTGLILMYISLCLPYSLWMLKSFLSSVPKSLEEAAFIDGAGRLRTLIQIVIPMTIPGIISTTVYSFTYVWNEYLFALVFMNSSSKMTFPVGLEGFVGHLDIYWEYILAGSTIISIPALIMFALTQSALVKGLGAGAVKG